MITVEGKCGISATILCDSISEAGVRLITYEIEYPRIILAELNTHGMLCRNSASSRAIPFAKMKEQLTGRPVRFGEANKGMQDKGEEFKAPVYVELDSYLDAYELTPEQAWKESKNRAVEMAEAFYNAGYHKQVYNRLTEPFQMMKTVLSGTELENYFWLRNHGAADPTIQELARCMFEAREKSVPQVLKAGEWHLPYLHSVVVEHIEMAVDVPTQYDRIKREQTFYLDDSKAEKLTLDEAIKVSAARCAAVSFRNEDYGLEKCLEVHARLVGDDRKHASAMCHQATPMKQEQVEYDYLSRDNIDTCESVNVVDVPSTWQEGVSHMDRDGQLWSAQFRGWIMYRKLIPGENYTGS